VRSRRTARVLLFDGVGRVLLIRFVVPRDGGEFVFWGAPGGEIEAGESAAEAAVREVREELGLELTVEGPVYEEANCFLHQGEMRDNVDFFFKAFCEGEGPVLKGVTADEIAIMKEIRWWSVEEIVGAEERIFPVDLAAKVGALQRV
jgi:8-oxo-dGTP diphosphatase